MTSRIARLFFALSGSIAMLASAATTAFAQDDGRTLLDEITVTAAYREQGLQDVPVSISAVTGDMIANVGLQKVEDIQFLVPNFNMTETGISTNIFIRGIGSGINQAFEQSVGTYIDGVYYGRAQQARAPFLDLERVEVLRGAQSILFGKNSVAGALNITTAKPGDEFEGSVFVSNEFEDSEMIVEGMLSGPFSDTVRARVAVRSRELDGYMTNATLNRDEPNREDWAVRGTLQADLTPDLTATLKVDVGEFDVTGRHIEVVNEQPATTGPFAGTGLIYSQALAGAFMQDPSVLNVVKDGIRSSNGDFSNNESTSYVLTLDWALGEHDLKSISAFSDFEYDEFCDCDYTGAVVFGAALQEQYEQFSQEFRLSSPLRDDYDYILGVYYQTSDHDYADQILVPANSVLVPALNGNPLLPPGSGTAIAASKADRLAFVKNDVLSAFAQFNWHLNEAWTLQLGGRITQDERDGRRTLRILGLDGNPLPPAQGLAPVVYSAAFRITSEELVPIAAVNPLAAGLLARDGTLPVAGTRDKTKFSPEIKLVWDATDDALLYFTWAQGFKSGSFDFRANNRGVSPTMAESFEFDDEEATNFELGGKFSLADGAAEINAAAFFTDFSDLQISIFDSGLGFNVGNAATAEVLGLEVDGRWAATENLTITGGFAVTDFEFTNFRNGQCYFGQTPNVDFDGNGTPELCDYTGKSNQMVSDFQGNVAFNFTYPVFNDMEFTALLDVFYTSEYDASATFDPALVQDAYSMYNLRLGIGPAEGNWEIALLGKNLGDEKVLQFGGDTPLASTFGFKSNYAFYSRGRQFTLQGVLRF
ncbi:MAG: TonB-dependent receptor [Gammaproteobacteria bacterium]|nr:TonB-dependent receptor [Gammaproteobacteria bacterium]